MYYNIDMLYVTNCTGQEQINATYIEMETSNLLSINWTKIEYFYNRGLLWLKCEGTAVSVLNGLYMNFYAVLSWLTLVKCFAYYLAVNYW